MTKMKSDKYKVGSVYYQVIVYSNNSQEKVIKPSVFIGENGDDMFFQDVVSYHSVGNIFAISPEQRGSYMYVIETFNKKTSSDLLELSDVELKLNELNQDAVNLVRKQQC